MKASLHWLKEYVDIHLSPDELGDALTRVGLEVDSIVRPCPNLNNIVVGQILSLEPHPNADKLSLCKVTTGDDFFSVVCGATNMKNGDKVSLALEKAMLPNGIKIKKSRIRGEVSEGMLCSEAELNISDAADGIMILEDSIELGKDISSALHLDDYIFELSITPNRSDCLSIVGIAREIAAITGQSLKMPETGFKEESKRTDELVSVQVEDTESCPRYSARLITDITIGPSPLWMRRRLISVGIRPICNVVDITNFVLMEYGQPLHAFDFDLLEGRKIVVKRANDGDTFTSLDGTERRLFNDTLMICDGEKSVAIGGVMGGCNSEVTDETSCVLIESAYFSPIHIRKTSKKLGLQTESSFRFERGIDPEGVLRASNRAAKLMLDLCGGKAAKGIIDQYPSPGSPRKISLSIKRTNRLLGTSLKKKKILKYLKSIELNVQNGDEDKLKTTVPSFRIDLNREVDLIEEVARLNGYDNIPATTPKARVSYVQKGQPQILEERLKSILSVMGYFEVINYSFISPHSLALLHIHKNHPYHKCVKIQNPLSEDQSIMRTTLIPGLLRTMQTNVYSKNIHLKLFEVGTVFFSKGKESLPHEKKMLCALATGLRYCESWSFQEEEIDFYDVKGTMENLFKGLGVRDFNCIPAGDVSYLDPDRSSLIMIGDVEAGVLGEVHSDILNGYGLSRPAYLFEIDLDVVARHAFCHKKVELLPKFPPIYRDVALIVKEEVESQDIYDIIFHLKNKLIEDVQIFDVYRGGQIPPDKKSLAYRIKYQSYERTLTDREINKIHEELVSNLQKKIEAGIGK